MKRVFFAVASIGSLISLFLYYFTKTSLLLAVGLVLLLFFSVIYKASYKICIGIIVLLIMNISFLNANLKIEKAESFVDETVKVDAVVVENSDVYSNATSTIIKIKSSNILPKNMKVQLWSYDLGGFSCGERATLKIKLKSLEDSEYQRWLYAEDVFITANLVETVAKQDNDIFYSSLQKIRDYVKSTDLNNLPYECSATLLGITIGEKGFFSEQFSNNIRKTGVSHVMVVSGLHLSIIMSAVFRVVKLICNNRFFKSLVSLAFVLGIIAICGFTISSVRAGLMFIIASFAPAFSRENDSINTLGLAVVLIYIASPFAIFSLSFQLSVLATLGIVAVAPFFNKFFDNKITNKFIKAVVEITVNTLCATVITMPVTIYNFSSVSLISPVTNILISYAVSVVLVCNVVAIIISLIPILSTFSAPFFFVSAVVCKYINLVINTLAKVPFAAVKVPNWTCIFARVLSIIILYVMYACKRKKYLLKLNETR